MFSVISREQLYVLEFSQHPALLKSSAASPVSCVSALIHGINTRLNWSGWQGYTLLCQPQGWSSYRSLLSVTKTWSLASPKPGSAAQGVFWETVCKRGAQLIWALMVPTALCEQEKGQTRSREGLWAWEDVMWKTAFRLAWTGGLREMDTTINFLFEWKQSQKSLSLLFLTNTCYMIGSTAFNFGHSV